LINLLGVFVSWRLGVRLFLYPEEREGEADDADVGDVFAEDQAVVGGEQTAPEDERAEREGGRLIEVETAAPIRQFHQLEGGQELRQADDQREAAADRQHEQAAHGARQQGVQAERDQRHEHGLRVPGEELQRKGDA